MTGEILPDSPNEYPIQAAENEGMPPKRGPRNLPEANDEVRKFPQESGPGRRCRRVRKPDGTWTVPTPTRG